MKRQRAKKRLEKPHASGRKRASASAANQTGKRDPKRRLEIFGQMVVGSILYRVEELSEHIDDRYNELLAFGAAEHEARDRALEVLNKCDRLGAELHRREQPVRTA